MHGYIDSINIPLHLPASAFKPSTSSNTNNSNNNKGKGKATNQDAVKEGQYDVVASWNAKDLQEVEKMVKMASILGYSTLMLNISIPPTFDPSKLSFPTPLFPSIDPRTAKPGTQGLVLQVWRITVENYSDEAVKGAGQKGWYGFANSTAPLYPQQTTLLSVVPTTLSSFSHVALSLSPPSAHSPTLITLDPSLSPRLPFPLKRGMISTLARFGVCFEIILRGITRQDLEGEQAGESGKRRRNWISGAREVVRATEGKGVVFSSGARSAGEMRGAQDLINLCSLIGMPAAQAKDALTVNPQRAIMRGLSLRSTYRGVISNPVLKIYAPTMTNTDGEKSEMEVDTTTTEGGQKGTTPKKRPVEGGENTEAETTTKQIGGASGEKGRSNGKAKKRKV
ncbi:RNA-binding RNA processing protein RPP1 [Sporobolomyces salmoneus]|uniref:RNA-binding RNA processing protein RPP1 n=1 Tax=Sporobolomyces salmoneus TaxID=183962 RepID=UPI00316D08B4